MIPSIPFVARDLPPASSYLHVARRNIISHAHSFHHWFAGKSTLQSRPSARVTSLLLASLLTIMLCAFEHATLYAQAEPMPAAQDLQQWQPVDTIPADSHTSKPVISPDQRFVAVTIVPLGTETAFLARTQLYEVASKQLRYTVPGYLPRWQIETGSGSLLLELLQHNRASVIYRVGNALEELPSAQAQLLSDQQQRQATAITTATGPVSVAFAGAELVYPQTIRVAHHPSNGCRDVADWQVNVIPFEEYVARVVPAENPASWPIDALAAQAVAARTYAWRQILVNRPDYDVTDWANFQMMCDDRYPSSDQAVAMTAGQYLAALDDANAFPISAMYSAENGHPTLTNTNVTYLQSVPDQYGLGRTRWGHGYGLSQWGAARRARAGQNYRQILGHYYSNIYLSNGVERTMPIGAIWETMNGDLLADATITLRAMVPPHAQPQFTIAASQGLTTTATIVGNGHTWFPPVTLAHGTTLTATLWLDGQPLDQQQWQIARQHPAALSTQAAATLPTLLDQRVLTITLPYTASLPLLSAPELQWEGEALSHMINSGATVTDLHAINGIAWAADPAQHNSGAWYGPYTRALRAGHSYRALFWLRTTFPNDLSSPAPAITIGTLDVTDDEGRIPLGLRQLRLGDFVNSERYTPIAVDFHLFDSPRGLEFRVAWAGELSLWFDRVEIWQLPEQVIPGTDAHESATDGRALFRWDSTSLIPATGLSTPLPALLQIRYMDQAANLSVPYDHVVTLVDSEPPFFGRLQLPPAWISAAQIATPGLTLTATLTDTFSGLDPARGLITVTPATGEGEGKSTSATMLAGAGTPSATATARITETFIALDASAVYTVTFAAYDLAGNRASRDGTLWVDAMAPSVTITTTGTSVTATATLTNVASLSHISQPMKQTTHYLTPAQTMPANRTDDAVQVTTWYTTPLTVTARSTDDTSGVELLTTTVAAVSATGAVTTVISEVTSSDSFTAVLTQGGIYRMRARAQDRAGNLSTTTMHTVALDLAPPTVLLTQQVIDGESVRVQWVSVDDGSGVDQVVVQLRRDGNAWEEINIDRLQPEAGVNIPLLSEQSTTVRARARDRVGQWGQWVELELWLVREQIYLPLIRR